MKISIEELKDLALRLKFEMKEEEYETLLEEFDVMFKQMELLEKIENVDNVEPMVFPFDYQTTSWREDEIETPLSVEEVLKNASETFANMIKVDKVVG